MSKKILGLALSEDSLTGVVFIKSLRKTTIIDGYSVSYDESFDVTLSLLLSKLDLKGCSSSALCLPASLISFKILRVPSVSTKKIRQILRVELPSQLPTSHAGYISDFLHNDILSQTSNCKKHPNHIITASLPVDVMDIYFPAMKKHFIYPELITSQGMVLATYLQNTFLKIVDYAIIIEATKPHIVITTLYKKTVIDVRPFLGKLSAAFVAGSINQIVDEINKQYNLNLNSYSCIVLFISDRCGDSNEEDSNECLKLNYLINKIIYIIDIFDHVSITFNTNGLGCIDKDIVYDNNNHCNFFNAAAVALCAIKKQKIINFCQGTYENNYNYLFYKVLRCCGLK
ncbi:MAG: hypothetical protein HQK65_22840 [Desulfamplus sp.]|nr:hypothetical protein [Desulfamplus sp.]